MVDINGNGIKQTEFANVINSIQASFDAVLTKLDADGGVADANYNTLHAIGSTGLSPNGMRDDLLISFLDTAISNINLVLAKLDADGTVDDTDYVTSLAVTDVVNNLVQGNITSAGHNQGNVINLIDDLLTTVNSLNAKLDADTGVSDANYGTLHDISDTVDASHTTVD